MRNHIRPAAVEAEPAPALRPYAQQVSRYACTVAETHYARFVWEPPRAAPLVRLHYRADAYSVYNPQPPARYITEAKPPVVPEIHALAMFVSVRDAE